MEKYLLARQIATNHGIPWTSSGSRPSEIHGPYCNINRNVLNVIPGGFATACFKITSPAQASDNKLVIGTHEIEAGENRWLIDHIYIRELQQKLEEIQIKCRNCINQYHCTFTCPDSCPLDGLLYDQSSFRCEIRKRLTDTLIDEISEKYRSTQIPDSGITGGPVMTGV